MDRELIAELDLGRTDRVAKHFTDGTHRIEDPGVTLKHLLPRLGEFGVTRLARITGLDRTGLEVMTVVRPNARSISIANGKGISLAAAKASGIMEAVERWHAERPSCSLRFGFAEDLEHGAARAYVEELPLMPHAALPRGPIVWAVAFDLTGQRDAFVPFDLVHTCWLEEGWDRTSPFLASTTGLASGSHVLEATLHALCEVIEHDALRAFEEMGTRSRHTRRIDLASIEDTAVDNLVGNLRARGFAVALWDLTSDLGVATLASAIIDERDPGTPAGFGSGCHPCRSVAALRALTEAAQTRLIAITGAREDLGPELYGRDVRLRFQRAIGEAADINMDAAFNTSNEATTRMAEASTTEAAGRWEAIPTAEHTCLREELRDVVERVAVVGPVLVTSIATENRLSVVRVLVPGLTVLGAARPAGNCSDNRKGA